MYPASVPTCLCDDGLTAMRLADCAGLFPRVSEPDEDEKCSMTSQLDLRGTGGGVCTSGRRADRAGEEDSSKLACRLLMAAGKPARPCCRRLRLRRVNRGFPVAAASSCNTRPTLSRDLSGGAVRVRICFKHNTPTSRQTKDWRMRN
jgi:hypothetical protein